MPIIKKKLYKIALVCVIFLLLFACAAPRVQQRVLMPANADVMKNSKKIAVVGFHGDRNKIFTRKLESFFTSVTVQNKPYFQVIDHGTLQGIIQSEFIMPKNVLDQAAKLGELANPAEMLSAIEKIASTVGKLAPGLDKLPAPGLDKVASTAPVKLSPKPSNVPGVLPLPGIDSPAYIFKPTDAIRLGQLSGADTILTGVVKWPYVKYTPYTEERSECVKREESKSSNPLTPGIKTKKCVKYEKRIVKCTKQTSNIEYAIKAVSVQNNQITFTKDYAGQAENKYCSDQKNAGPVEPKKLSDKAMAVALNKMRHDIAPYVVTLSIQLMNKDDSQLRDIKEIKMILDNGLKFAKKGRMDKACEHFQQAETQYNQSPALYYNLGVCAEIKNQLDAALQLYKHADGLTTKNYQTITAALNRIEDRKLKQEKVQEQLR